MSEVLSRRFVVRRNGTVRQREHYLRDDIPCGHPLCLACAPPGHPPPEAPGSGFPSFRKGTAPGDIDIDFDISNDDDDDSSSDDQQNPPSPAGKVAGKKEKAKYGREIPGAPSLPARARLVAVVDTNVALHQLDVLEMPQWTGVVLLQTVLEEVRHRSRGCHERLVKLSKGEAPDIVGTQGVRSVDASHRSHPSNSAGGGEVESVPVGPKGFYVFSNEHHSATYVERRAGESPNDRNDRAIRAAAAHLARHWSKCGVRVVLVTNDRECARLAREEAGNEGVEALTVHEYVKTYLPEHSVLMDMLAGGGDEDEGGDGDGDGNGADKDLDGAAPDGFPPEHLPERDMRTGIAAGRFFQGTLRMRASNSREGSVYCASKDMQVLLSGPNAINRAVDGDVVTVQLADRKQWIVPDDFIAEEEQALGDAGGDGGDDGDGGKKKGGKTGAAARRTGGPGSVPTGRVVGILKRNWRSYCGSLGPAVGRDWYLFLPVDPRVPAVRIRTRQAERLRPLRFVVHIDAWDRTQRSPVGHYVRDIGPIGDREAETEVICIETQVPLRPFTDAVLRCLPPEGEGWRVSVQDLAERTDLRDTEVMSVDPPGCTDIDDAVHVRDLGNGQIELGVHIADVTHFVRPDTPLDAEARARGNTVYLVDRRIDMVPPLLGTNLCSLRPGVERLAFSVTWVLEGVDPSDHSGLGDSNLRVVSRRFFRSVIKSRAALSYGEAQAIIDDPSDHSANARNLRLLLRLTRVMRTRRKSKGSLVLASPAVTFSLDRETMDPDGMETYTLREANAMIEELMLLANVAVAEVISSRFPESAMLRRHPPPSEELSSRLQAMVATRGVNLDFGSGGRLSASLDAATRDGDPYFNTLIRVLTTRCMQQAVYFSAGTVPIGDWFHFGLAAEVYTHFTSPIRRYADVCVHRALAAIVNGGGRDGISSFGNLTARATGDQTTASIGHANNTNSNNTGGYSSSSGRGGLDDSLLDKDKAEEIARTINERHRLAQASGRESVALHTLIFFREKRVTERARVTRVRRNAFTVIVPRYGIEGIVYVQGKGRGKNPAAVSYDFTYSATDETLSPPPGKGPPIGVFSPVVVEISVDTSVPHRHKLRMDLIDADPGLADDEAAADRAAKASEAASAKRKAEGDPNESGEAKPAKKKRGKK